MPLNRICIQGNCTRDPQLRYLGDGKAVVDCGIASNRKYGNKEEVTFVDFTLFGASAEAFNKHMTKGKAVIIEGRLRTEQWEAKDGSGNRSKNSIIADAWHFAGGPKEDAGKSSDAAEPAPRRADAYATAGKQQRAARYSAPAPQPPFGEDDSHFDSENIPFFVQPIPARIRHVLELRKGI